MNISYILTENIDPDGSTGASAHVRENVKNLRQLGHNVTMVNNPTCQDNGLDNGSNVKLGKKMYQAIAPKPIKQMASAFKTRKSIQKLIATNLTKINSCDVIYERDAFHSFEIYNRQRTLNKPWIIECNGFFWGDMSAEFHQPVFERAYQRRHLEKWKAADHLIAVSSRFKEKMIAEGVPSEKITVIHNGVDEKSYENADLQTVRSYRKFIASEDKIVIGFIGSILPWHRIDLFLESIKILKEDYPIKGLIVGGGIWETYLEKAKDMGLDNDVEFTGKIEPKDVPTVINAMDICTLPGSTDYNSPVKIFDYGAAKKPVLAADFQAVSEILDDGVTGLMFKKGNIQSYINNMKTLLGDSELRNNLGMNLHKHILNNHTWEKVAQKTNTILTDVVHHM